MANISHIKVNGEVLDIKDASGGGYYVGHLVSQTVHFKTDEMAVAFYMRGASVGNILCMGGNVVSIDGSMSPSNCGYEDGEYYLTNPNSRDEYFILINAYDITITDD